MGKKIAIWLAAGVAAVLPLAGVSAAPQILAALPSEGGIPFTCNDAGCRADLSTYCMLRNRPAPGLGAEYMPAVPGRFTLVITDAQGRQKSLPAHEHVRFVENRGFMSISAKISSAELKRLGAARAVIRVAKNASLLPVPEENDPDPLTEKEIAYATGSLRAHSAEFMEKRPAAATARVLSAVANRLPLMRDFDSSEFESLWRDVIEGIPSGSPELDAIGPARAKAGICMDDVESFRFSTMRRCLEWRHDEMIRDLNHDYWDAQVGS